MPDFGTTTIYEYERPEQHYNSRACTGRKHNWPNVVHVEESGQAGEPVSNAVVPKSLELSMKQRMTAACSRRRFSVLAFIFSLPSPEWRRLGARITDRLLLSILFSALLEKERGEKWDPAGRLNKLTNLKKQGERKGVDIQTDDWNGVQVEDTSGKRGGQSQKSDAGR